VLRGMEKGIGGTLTGEGGKGTFNKQRNQDAKREGVQSRGNEPKTEGRRGKGHLGILKWVGEKKKVSLREK